MAEAYYPFDFGLSLRPWTEPHSVAAEFRHVVRTEGELLPDGMQFHRLVDGVDKEVAALYMYGFLASELSQGELHYGIKSKETYRHALKAAFAARLFRDEKERWPSTIEELVPTYLSSLPPDSSTSATRDRAEQLLQPGKFPYGPIRIEQTTVTQGNAARLLGLVPAIYGYSNQPHWNISFTVIESPVSGRFQGRFTVTHRQVNNLSPLVLFGLAEKLKAMSVIKRVRIIPEDSPANLWHAYRAAADRIPELKTLLADTGTTVPLDAPLYGAPLSHSAPFIEADLDMPDSVFAVISDGPDRTPSHEPQLMLDRETTDGEPTGDLIVCAESF